MNEFLEQFLIESRELVDRATDDLLALEKSPGDEESLAGAFRAFHTLKGGAAIVEFAVMERGMHRVESALDEVRAGKRPITVAFIGDCLAALTQVIRWLDVIQASGDIPSDAETAAAVIEARLGQRASEPPKPAQDDSASANTWAAALLSAHPDVAAQAKTAIRYKPPADCFFSDEDPLAIIAALPELLSVDIEPVQPWPSLDGLNPFDCNLILKALTRQSAREVAIVLGNRMNQCEIEPLNALQSIEESTADAGAHASWPQARKLAEEQIALLAEAAEPAASAGRVASAGAVVANALRYLGRLGDADRLDRATAESLVAKDPDLLRRQIIAVFQQTSPTKAAPITTASQNHRQDSGAQTLRVDAARIDALVRLTGELTVAKNAIGHIARLAWTEENSLAPLLKSSHETFEQLVGELQRAALGMRILPLRHVFQRFSRLIREISSDLGKSARLVVEGEDTEADKAVVESLFEPLLHVLRNAMDHGVEDTAERAAAHKPAVATVHLRAARQGEHVIVEVEDDGRGIDAAKIRQVARERSLMSDEKLGAMNDAEIADLIFAPGFSTAAQVTGLSGRGVGMDAVRTAVRHLGGQVTIDSAPGQGTTVRFILPYSVMVTQVMIVEAGSQLFGVPLDAVVETRRIPKGSIAPIGAGQAIVLDDQTIPLLELAEALGLHRADNRQEEATVVVVKLNGSIGALQVDRLVERMEIMLKPLDGLLAGMPGIAGSTLLGDGSVLLVLDLGELIQ